MRRLAAVDLVADLPLRVVDQDLALPALDARPVDASGTLDVLAEAGVGGGRATVFVVYENALASRAYAGAYVVPVYPLPGPRLRFGVFWLLPN